MKTPPRVALSMFESEFPRPLIGGILKYAQSQTNWEFHMSRGFPLLPTRQIHHWNGDGLIVACTSLEQMKLLSHVKIPIVNVASRSVSPPFPTVTDDNHAIGRMAAEHLLAHGYKQFAFVGSSTMLYDKERERGFADALGDRGIKHISCVSPVIFRQHHHGDSLLHKRGYLMKILRKLPTPIGIMSGSDAVGCGLLLACKALGLRVPDSVGIVSCDNDDLLCEMVQPGLSSIERQTTQIGYQAAQLLDHLMNGGSATARVIRVPPGRLIQRQSSDAICVADPEVAAAMRFIRNHAAHSIDVSDVLDHVPISRRLLEMRFRQAIGSTIHSEIRRAHIQLATELLRNTDLSVAEVSRRSGYNHETLFRAAFKKETGQLPRAFQHDSKATSSAALT